MKRFSCFTRILLMVLPVTSFKMGAQGDSHLQEVVWYNEAEHNVVVSRRFIPETYKQLYEEYYSADAHQEYNDYVRCYHADTTMDWQRIYYTSDGLRVVGFIIKPVDIPVGKKLPVIIFNRGGYSNLGKITVRQYPLFRKFLDHGYVIFACQYRGNDGGQGRDEFGGSDVNDVINLIQLARQQEYVDVNNMFMFGWSRGGMMTFLALKAGAQVNAVATTGALTDLERCWADRTPRERSALQAYFAPSLPMFSNPGNLMEEFKKRSACCWADHLKVPVMLVHGTHDKVILPNQSELLAHALRSHQHPCELVTFEGGHDISLDTIDDVCRWFECYKNNG